MTIDLKEHITKKQLEKNKKIANDIGKQLNGVPLEHVVNILVSFLHGIAVSMKPQERFNFANYLRDALLQDPPAPEPKDAA